MINCYGCNKPIDDMYYLLAGEQFYWHFNCLKCASCAIVLNEQSKCYLANGKFYCSQHYYSIKSNELSNKENFDYAQPSNKVSSCKHCKQLIKSDDYVIRLKPSSSAPSLSASTVDKNSLYHLNCFVCNQCNKKIMPGELYGHIQSINNTELIFCNQHYYEQMFKSKSQFDTSSEIDILFNNSTNQNDLSQYTLSTTTLDLNNNKTTNKELNSKKNLTSKRTKNENDQSKTSRNLSAQQQTQSASSALQNSVKRKRYRTSFKHQQLGVLKQYFQMNPNPDSKDLTVLSKRTGLQNRVLQVWFQNARAKQRKSSGSNSNDTSTTMAKNFYSSILETDLNSLNKSSLDEGEEDEDEEAEDDEEEEDENTMTNNDDEDNEHLTSENDSNEQPQQIVQNQHDMFDNQQQNLCFF